MVEKEKRILERTNLSRLFISHDFESSAIVIIVCYLAFLPINLAIYIYRARVLKERVNFFCRKSHYWVIREVAKGRPVSAAMFFTGICDLEFKIFGVKFDDNYTLGVGLC